MHHDRELQNGRRIAILIRHLIRQRIPLALSSIRRIRRQRTRNRPRRTIIAQTFRQLPSQLIRHLAVATRSRGQHPRIYRLSFGKGDLTRHGFVEAGDTIHPNREHQRGWLFAIDIRHPIRHRIPVKGIPRKLRRRTRNRPSPRIKRQTRWQLPVQAIRPRYIPTFRLRQLQAHCLAGRIRLVVLLPDEAGDTIHPNREGQRHSIAIHIRHPIREPIGLSIGHIRRRQTRNRPRYAIKRQTRRQLPFQRIRQRYIPTFRLRQT